MRRARRSVRPTARAGSGNGAAALQAEHQLAEAERGEHLADELGISDRRPVEGDHTVARADVGARGLRVVSK